MNGSHLTCYYCKLHHPKVEAGGVYHCPNPLCTGCGANLHRRSVPSYQEHKDGTHSVDGDELVRYWTPRLAGLDESIRDAAIRCIPKWTEETAATSTPERR